MKPVNIVVGLGTLAVAGLGVWYMYMQGTPQYEKSAQRGLDPGLFPSGSPSAPATPSSAPVAPSSDAAAPSSGGAAPASGAAAPSSGADAPSSGPAAPSS